MWIKFGNLVAKVDRCAIDEFAWLREYLTFRDKSDYFRKGRKARQGTCLLNKAYKTFPAGLVGKVKEAGERAGFQMNIVDVRKRPCVRDPNADLAWLRDYQGGGVDAVCDKTRGILKMVTGAGKCLGIGTPVLRYDGTVVPVEQIKTGDLLVGPDSRPRTVLSTMRGSGELFKISPLKGDPWVCNDVHVLTLEHTLSGERIDVSLNEYLGWSKSKKHKWKQCAQPVTFQNTEPLPIDPYFLGLWFADGRKDLTSVAISKPDPEVYDCVKNTARQWQATVSDYTYGARCPTWAIVTERGKPNPLLNMMRLVVGKDVKVPHKYLTNTFDARMAFLAGWLDGDGYLGNGTFEVTSVRSDYALALAFLARSLGYRALISEKPVDGKNYYRVSISGMTHHIPTRIPRKQAQPRKQKKNVLRTGFSVKPLGKGDYAGFTLDGDGRFLLGDFTVTHNTEVAIGITRALPCKWLFLVHRAQLLSEAAERYERRAKEHGLTAHTVAGRCGDGIWQPEERFTVATFQTLAKSLGGKGGDLLKDAEGIIIDECHTLPADSFWHVAMTAEKAYFRIGMSGTPLARGDKRSVFAVGALGRIIYEIKPELLIDRGVLSKPKIRMMKVIQESEKKTWNGVYSECVVNSRIRNRAVLRAAQRAAKPSLVFVKEVKHGHTLEKLLNKNGLKAKFVYGKDQTSQRKTAIKNLVRGELDVLICSVIFQEGVDIPELESVIIASGGKSIIAALQRIGRGMRVTEGKNTVEVYDFDDRGNKWLERHSRARIRSYAQEGHEVVYDGELFT